MKSITLILFVLLCTYSSFGQIITGNVTDAADAPLPGVTIIVGGTTKGTTTDFDGNYSIEASSGDILQFSYIGMLSKEVTMGSSNSINVILQEDSEQLDEVIVTAFGISQEKKSLGYAAQNIDADAITKTKQTNLVSALQGQVAGVQITNSVRAPGQSSRIIIRGINSLDPSADNQPLFVVDGVPIDNSTIESGDNDTPRGLTNRAADINPADVESMSVLKGAAATALYGVRAANGAVIITTKRGKSGRVSINLNTSVGFDELNSLPKLQKQYGQGFSGEYDPTSFWPSWGAPISEVAQTVPGHKYQDNWNRAFNTGLQTDHSLSVSGGGENATFYGSFGRFDQKGIIPFSDWARTTAKFSGTVKVSEKFDFSGSINYSNSGGNRVPHDRFMERMMYWAETQDVRDYINPDGTMKTYGNTNPIYDARFSTFEDDVNRMIGNLNFNYSPTDWLTLSYRLGTDYYSDARTSITPGPKGIVGEVPLSATGSIEETRINSKDITSNFYLTLKKQWNDDLNTTLRLGNDVFQRKFDRVIARGEDFVIPDFYNLNATSQVFTDQDKSIRRLVGFYGDLMVNYKEYLFLNVTARNDISSTLPKENNSFFYPSVNLGYVFSENFELPSWFTFGKLRGSWAQVGKDTNPHVLGITYVAPDVFPLDGQVGFSRNSSFGDPELKPELTTSIEFGTQLSFFESRLDLDVTYYKSNAVDQIIPVPISDGTGFSEYITNAGEIQNSGIEIVLGGDIIKNKDFQWTATANLSMNNNEIKAIREGIDEIYTLANRLNLIVVHRQVCRGGPLKILIFDNVAAKYNFDSAILDFPGIGNVFGKTGTVGNGHRNDLIDSIRFVIRDIQIKPTFKKRQLGSKFNRCGLFRFEFGIPKGAISTKTYLPVEWKNIGGNVCYSQNMGIGILTHLCPRSPKLSKGKPRREFKIFTENIAQIDRGIKERVVLFWQSRGDIVTGRHVQEQIFLIVHHKIAIKTDQPSNAFILIRKNLTCSVEIVKVGNYKIFSPCYNTIEFSLKNIIAQS